MFEEGKSTGAGGHINTQAFSFVVCFAQWTKGNISFGNGLIIAASSVKGIPYNLME